MAEPEILTHCLYCEADYHEEEATEPDKYGLTCPGDNGSEIAKENYQLNRKSREKIVDTDWDEFAEQAQDAYEGRARSDGRTKEQLPETAKVSTALQEDCDTHVAEIKPTQPWLNIDSTSGDDVVRAQLEADEAAEAAEGNIDVQDRHLTVPGKWQERLIEVSDAIHEAKKGTHARADDAMLYLDPDVDGNLT